MAPLLELRLSPRWTGLIIVMAFVVMWAVYATMGLSLSEDGRAYLSAANTVRFAGGLPADWAKFPPLYALLLALFSPEVINAASIALLTGLLLTRTSLPLTILALVSPAFLAVTGWVLTEPLYCALLVLFFFRAERVRSIGDVAAIAGIAAFAALTRYVGLILIAGGLLIVPRRWWFIYAVIALLPVGAWMLRNAALVGAPMGGRDDPALYGIEFALRVMGSTLASWIPWLLIGMCLPPSRLQPRIRLTMLIFAAVHIAFILFSGLTTALDPPDNRLLLPAFIPLLLGLNGSALALRLRSWLGSFSVSAHGNLPA